VFCKRTRRLVLATIAFLAAFAWDGCGRKQAEGVERLAILPVENLSSDAQLNWGSRAAAAAVVYDLAGSKNIFAKQVASPPDAQAMRASRMLEGYLFERNGRMEIYATLENVARNKDVESIELDGPESRGVLPLANELARRLSGEARKFGTNNESAFRFYGQALAARDAHSAQQDLESATAADDGFADGYIDEVKLLAERGDREGAERAAQSAKRARLDEIDGANLEYAAARVSGSAEDRLKALESLAKVTPTDANVFHELAELRYGRREFPRAAVEYRAAAQVDPDDPRIWNELAYALAFGKDLKGARAALAQYQSLAPGDNNVLDSEGEVSYMLGDFKAASGYFENAAARNPAEWMKAAEARLMMGDLRGADVMFAKHPGLRTTLQLEMAQWRYLTGRREAGMLELEKLAPNLSGDLQALAFSQLAMWKLVAGDRRDAGELAKQGLERAQGAPVRGICAAVEFLVGGGKGRSSGSKMLDGYALLLEKKYGEAVPVLRAAYDETQPSSDWEIRTLLAWAYAETGAKKQAADLVEPYPLPLSSGDSLFAPVIFRRYLAVRAAVWRH
jgi:Flp pilus assembly protein TadD